MDIRCPKCAEQVDNDELHEAVSIDDYPDYKTALRAFQAEGCVAIFGGTPCVQNTAGLYASALYDLLGDDADGAAAMMEDFAYLFD